MNIYYYLFNKQAPFDISPILEKYIGGAPEEVREKEEFRRRLSRVERQSRQVASPGGVFDQKALLPATIVSSAQQQKNIEQIAEKMIQTGMAFMDYGGRTDDELRTEMPAQQTETYAIGDLECDPVCEGPTRCWQTHCGSWNEPNGSPFRWQNYQGGLIGASRKS